MGSLSRPRCSEPRMMRHLAARLNEPEASAGIAVWELWGQKSAAPGVSGRHRRRPGAGAARWSGWRWPRGRAPAPLGSRRGTGGVAPRPAPGSPRPAPPPPASTACRLRGQWEPSRGTRAPSGSASRQVQEAHSGHASRLPILTRASHVWLARLEGGWRGGRESLHSADSGCCRL